MLDFFLFPLAVILGAVKNTAASLVVLVRDSFLLGTGAFTCPKIRIAH